ncbi:cytochrome P450 81Q32-like [Salvia hispanica]|uniref:cytochrome P450 81Q32-like n=1 Tax=Salvia hispanica TaxID=49212 RepID=UPI002009376A|nr:cytochrome P450 81Q32-like [Salvia hispanica]
MIESHLTSKMETLNLIYLPLIYALYILTKHFLHKLQNLPPTPLLSLPLLGHLPLLKKPLYRSLAAISARHGPVVLLHLGSRPVLVVSSPSAAEDCLSKNDVVFANRPRLLAGKHIGYNYTSLAWTSYGDHWRNLRKVASIEVLSAHRLHLLHGIRADEVRALARALSRASAPVDMKAAFTELTMNVMMRMIAGKRYYGEKVEGAEEARRFKEIVAESLRLAASSVGDFVPVVRWLGVGGVEKAMVELQRKRNVFMQELVEERKRKFRNYRDGEEGRMKTMIEMLLALQEKEPEYYTDAIIRSLMLVMLIAGTDTSAGTMEWALSLLLNHPDDLRKARDEIDDRVGHDRLFDEADIANLPYLRCIINETLRMFPAGPLLIPHESSAECVVGGYRVPSGTMLLVNAWAMHNDPKNWDRPREFRPERFEKLDGYRDGFRLMPFGAGRRGCPGEPLAVRMVGLGLGTLIQCFDWERPGEELIDMSEGVGLSMPRATPLMAYCRARPVAAGLLASI